MLYLSLYLNIVLAICLIIATLYVLKLTRLIKQYQKAERDKFRFNVALFGALTVAALIKAIYNGEDE